MNTPKPDSSPQLDPVIGTRVEEDGVLTPTLEIDDRSTRYIGCDLRFANVPNGSEIEVVWLFKPVKMTDPARVIHQAWHRVHDGDTTPKRVWVDRVVDPNTHANALGSYECVWTLGARGVSARLVVRAAS